MAHPHRIICGKPITSARVARCITMRKDVRRTRKKKPAILLPPASASVHRALNAI